MSATEDCRRPRLALLGLLLAACSTPVPPPDPQPEVDPGANAANQGQPTEPTSQVVPLANGMTAVMNITDSDDDCLLQLGVLAGSLFVAPGLGELAAQVVIKSSDPSTGRRSLEQDIAAIGGTIEVRLGMLMTWFELRVPRNEYRRTTTTLRRALESVTTSRNQIERMRNELVADRGAAILQDPLASMARALLLGEPGTATYINGLLDLDPSQVSMFLSRLYRPERCMLILSAPYRVASLLESLQKPSQEAIAGWQPPPPLPGPSELLPRKLESGLYWSEAGAVAGKARTAIVLRLPDPTQPGAAEWLMMHACLTLDGTGGRLERLQDEAGLGHLRWQARIEQTPDAMALVMTTETSSQEAVLLWRVLQAARNSLVDVPPSPSELQLARRRAKLSAGLAMLGDSARLRITANLLTRTIPLDAVERRLDEIAEPGNWDMEQAAKSYVQQPAWMVVIGKGRPQATTVSGLREFDLLPTGFQPQNPSTIVPENLTSVDPWLARAKEAAGGARAIDNLEGFFATARLLPEQAPETIEQTTWHHSGSLLRRRTLLGQTVETVLDGNKWLETLGDVRKSLTAREATLLRHELQRHPLMLLAAHSRGEMKFRPIAQRSVGDREFMVLEAIGEHFDRLRIHLDTESCLVRVVESWERLADDTTVHIRDAWSDYRSAGALRTPFRRRTSWNDGQQRSETIYDSWLPTLGQR